jgi:hypothetical protein
VSGETAPSRERVSGETAPSRERVSGAVGYTTFPRAVLRSACGSNREVP